MTRWDQRIEAARVRVLFGFISCSRFTADDRKRAADWGTCAVGETRRRYGVRMDPMLQELGLAFYRAVFSNRVERAAHVRETIEEYALARKRREWERGRGRTRATASVPSL